MKTTSNEALDSILKPIAGLFLVTPALIALVALSSVWYGYVLQLLWGWFIVPPFGAPVLSIPAAIGLALTVGLLTKGVPKRNKDEAWWQGWIAPLLRPAVVLLVGWIVTKFL